MRTLLQNEQYFITSSMQKVQLPAIYRSIKSYRRSDFFVNLNTTVNFKHYVCNILINCKTAQSFMEHPSSGPQQETSVEIKQATGKKRISRKRKAQIEEITRTRPISQERQTLLTTYCKKTKSTEETTDKSEQFLATQTVNRVKVLEDQLSQKESLINALKAEKEKEQQKTHKVASQHKMFIDFTRRTIIKSTRQLSQLKRKEKGNIDPKLGYFINSNFTQFNQGQYIKQIRVDMKKAEDHLNIAQSNLKSKIAETAKNNFKGQIQFYRQQIRELKEELDIREKEVERYKDRLKLHLKEQQCQLAKEGWPVIKDRYVPMELIGTGGFGEVYKAFDLEQLRHVALKLSISDNRFTPAAYENFIKHLDRQIKIHKQLQHPNIVRVIEHIQLQGRTGLVLEYCSGPELRSYIRKAVCLEEREARHIIRQVVFAIKYLHDQKLKIVHYDLKPANIIFHEGLVKVVDFGICKTLQSEETKIDLTSPGIGTYWYLPPEVFHMDNPKVSSKVDIWSIGVIFFQMLYGEKPFGQGVSQMKILRDGVISNALNVEFPASTPKKYRVSNDAKDFIKACLKYNPEERLGPVEIYQHPYIKDYN